MATIKSFTSLEQSKKLAEILPLESADMFYDGVQDLYKEKVYSIPINGSSITVRTGHIITENGIKANLLLPCWSLAALLNLMICPRLEEYVKGVWNLMTFTDETLRTPIEIQDSKDPVDACVSMIIKLHKRNLLRL